MIQKFKEFFQKKTVISFLVVFCILIQSVYLSCIFAFQKEGYHSDEVYSYGLANSYHNPFLSMNKNLGYADDIEYMYVNEWISGEILQDYITVDEGNTFNYENVWYNQSLDRHPPLYYAVLHTVCSFFPEQFSPYFGFAINLICFVVLQIFLFLLSKKLFKSNTLALLTILCYGFSVGAVNTFMYIRMYAMITMWVVILAYLHARLLNCTGQIKIKNFIPITFIVMMGALTQHEFTIIAFVFAACFCLYYLFKKQIRNFLKYGCSMLIGVLMAWAVFNPLIAQIFIESGSNIYDLSLIFPYQLYTAWNYVINSLFGIPFISISTWVYLFNLILPFLFILLFFALPICYLFRYTKGVMRLKRGLKKFVQNFSPQKVWSKLKCINVLYLAMFLSSIVIICVLARTVYFAFTGYCDRYVFVVYPFVLLLCIAVFSFIFRKVKPIKKYEKIIVSVCFIVLLIFNVSTVHSDYLFEGANTIGNLEDLTVDSDCIIIDLYEWRMVCFAPYLKEAHQVFFTTTTTTYESICNELQTKTADTRPTYLFVLNDYAQYDNLDIQYRGIFGTDIDYSEEEFLKNYFGTYTQSERLGMVTIFSHNYLVYRMS